MKTLTYFFILLLFASCFGESLQAQNKVTISDSELQEILET